MAAAKKKAKKKYGADAITVLEGSGGRPQTPGHVYRLHRRARSAPPRLGGRRQRGRRGDGRLRRPRSTCGSSRTAASRSPTTAAASRSRCTPAGVPTVDVVMTQLHAGGKFGGENSGYNVSGGLHGVGVSVVNALSTRLEVDISRDGHEWFQSYDHAVPGTLKQGEATKKTGTTVRFWADPDIFETTELRLRDRGAPAAGDGLPQQGPDHHARRRAGDRRRGGRRGRQRHRRGAEVGGGEGRRSHCAAQGQAPHLPLPRRPGRLRQAHQPDQDARSSRASSTSTARATATRSRSRCSGTPATRSRCTPSPTPSTPTRAAPTKRASARR